MLKIGIVGVAGYTGIELLKLLLHHSMADIAVVTSDTFAGKSVAEVFPYLRSAKGLILQPHQSDQLASCDLVFFATPHGVAMRYARDLLQSGCKIIDLSADFRLKDPNLWRQWYQTQHTAPELIESAVYGLPEYYREEIRSASLIANPGCYPTAAILGLLPIMSTDLVVQDIIIDAKSGVSGAGRQAQLKTLYVELAGSFKAYGLTGHRHQPEIEQILQNMTDTEPHLVFVPHLLPMSRGILASIYISLEGTLDIEYIQKHYCDFYLQEPFIQILQGSDVPETRFVRGTNFCCIGIQSFIRSKSNYLLVIVAIDNLVKGAAGQAIQNMNLMFDFSETLGLDIPVHMP